MLHKAGSNVHKSTRTLLLGPAFNTLCKQNISICYARVLVLLTGADE